jgi:hypothetical protein
MRLPVIVLAAALLPAAAARAAPCDLALVLLADASGSVDEVELRTQVAGTADGIRDPAVAGALMSGRHGRAALAFGMWSQRTAWGMPWTVVESAEDVLRAADAIEASSPPEKRDTDLAQALRAAGDLLDSVPCDADRVVIDVSGDGVHNAGWSDLPAAREGVLGRGAVVNGLSIVEGGDPGVEAFYREEVAAGVGAFSMRADGMGDFARAIRVKLLREVAGR